LIRAIRNLHRMVTIARVLARHDVLTIVDWPLAGVVSRLVRLGRPPASRGRPGQRLAEALKELGPTFIKLGQALSTRADLVGEQMAADLSHLQDRLAPFPSAAARRIVEEQLGRPLAEIFSSFDEVAVAAASIAQVHFAITAEGREVAVKVLRPGVEAAFRRDIDLLAWLAEWAERARPRLRRLRLIDTVATFAESVALEMDLRFEAAAAAEMGENFAGDETFRVPAVDWLRTAKRVLTLERVSGVPVDERDRLAASGHDVEAILLKAAEAFFNMVFRDGFFHADMHPGNLFVDANGNLVAVDFGIVGRVDMRTRRFLGAMLIGFLNGDYRRVAEVHFEAGYVPADKSIDAFTQACRSIAGPILGRPLHEISVARLLGQLFEVTETFAMETQPQLLLLQKSMLVAEGIGRNLDPAINMWQLARPLIETWMRRNLGPQARVRDMAVDALSSLERLPRLLSEIEKTAAILAEGGIKLHPDTVRDLTADAPRQRRTPDWLPWVVALALAVALAVK